MMYPTITITHAREAMRTWPLGEASADVEIKWIGLGESVEGQLDLLLNSLTDLTLQIGEGHANFDSLARPIVHESLSEIDQEVLLVPDFWRYLSSVKFAQIVAYRHGEPSPELVYSKNKLPGQWRNYGAYESRVSESLIHRLYVGASLAFDQANSQDPYHLCRIEDVDVWQSHIIRVLTGENPSYVRALLSWFRDRETWYGGNVSRLGLSGVQKTKHIREIAKGVRHLRSNVMHEFLTETEILDVIHVQAEKSFAIAQVYEQGKKSS